MPKVLEAVFQVRRQKPFIYFPLRGPLNIQLRLSEDGVPVPFELNVRFSGTTPMRARFGFCDVEAMLREVLLHQKIDNCFHIRNGSHLQNPNRLHCHEKSLDDSQECLLYLANHQTTLAPLKQYLKTHAQIDDTLLKK